MVGNNNFNKYVDNYIEYNRTGNIIFINESGNVKKYRNNQLVRLTDATIGNIKYYIDNEVYKTFYTDAPGEFITVGEYGAYKYYQYLISTNNTRYITHIARGITYNYITVNGRLTNITKAVGGVVYPTDKRELIHMLVDLVNS